jgi:hypothetical protein
MAALGMRGSIVLAALARRGLAGGVRALALPPPADTFWKPGSLPATPGRRIGPLCLAAGSGGAGGLQGRSLAARSIGQPPDSVGTDQVELTG